MSIRYALFANGLTSGVNDYSAHVEGEGLVDGMGCARGSWSWVRMCVRRT